MSTKPASPMFRMALDYGPLAVFFAVNFLAPGAKLERVIAATAAFMVAMVVAMVLSWTRTRHISPMLWMSGLLVLVFGSLTLYFHDETFIKMKPTLVYALFCAILVFGLVTRRPLLQQLLGTAYPGVDAVGWRKLTVNWAGFFAFMAVLNEAVWRSTSWDFWVGFKLWGAVPLTLVFALLNVPMLMRHGLKLEEETPVPPEG